MMPERARMPEGRVEFIGEKIRAYTNGTTDASSNGQAGTERAP